MEKRAFRSRICGPLGAMAVHGALLVLLFHFNALHAVFGQSPADDVEWVWLPEVTLVAAPPEEPPPPEPPEPEIEAEDPPLPEPEPIDLPEWVPVEPQPQPEIVEEPELEPIPEPPPVVVETSPPGHPDAWTEVRTGIMNALRYPAHARRNGIAGVVTARLRLDESGQIVSAEILSPAPAKSLCDAVLSAVRHAGPFPAVGEAIRQGQTPAAAEIPIRFELDRPSP
jgi:TonB family protein